MLDILTVERDNTAGRVEAILITPDNTVGAGVGVNVGAVVEEDIDHYLIA